MHFQTYFVFDDISERDMDMLFMEEFACSPNFLKLFTGDVGIAAPACVKSIQISKMDPALGESDLTVIIESNSKKIGLLIEDKIDAIAMPEQSARYLLRGEKGIKNGEYDEFHVFIVAPEKYLSQNAEAQKYPHKIRYERIISYFEGLTDPRAEFKLQQLLQAVDKQKKGYQVEVDPAVTAFWKEYSAFQKSRYSDLNLLYNGEDKGANSTWPNYNTIYKGLNIIHKTEKGFADLTFDRCADSIAEIEEMLSKAVENYQQNGFTIHKTGKAAALRLTVPKLDLHKPFDEQLSRVDDCLAAIKRLSDLARLFPASQVFSFLERNRNNS